jgi:hypothetical protein
MSNLLNKAKDAISGHGHGHNTHDTTTTTSSTHTNTTAGPHNSNLANSKL